MALLGRPTFILSQPLVDDGQERLQNRAASGNSQGVARWSSVMKGLPDGATIVASLSGDLSDALALNEIVPPNLFALIHFKHPCPPVRSLAKASTGLPETFLVGEFSIITSYPEVGAL